MSQNPPSAEAPFVTTDGATTYYVTYLGDTRTIDGIIRQTLPLATAFDRALAPGDVIQFLPGTYWPPTEGERELPLVIKGVRGTPDRPVTIRGLGARTAISGADGAVPLYPALPTAENFAFFQLIDCEGVTIENFEVSSCWPCFVYIEDSRYVSVRSIRGIDSLYFVFARGETTHHILIEGCRWRQDPTAAIWTDIDWVESHDLDYRFYNGGLLGSDAMAGSVVFRDNIVIDCYNAMRLKAKGEGAFDRLNRDVEVCGNYYLRTRDNPVEPEWNALNWWIHHNTIQDGYAWFSFDGVAGGYWAVFANKGWFTSKPGQPTDGHTGGRVFKFDDTPPYPTFPVEVFNNSWYLRSEVIKSGATRNFIHRNNAVQFCDPARCAEGVCQPGMTIVGAEFMADGWNASVVFDHDVTNHSFGRLAEFGQETHGICDPEFRFSDPARGEFGMPSPIAGAFITLPGWPCDDGWQPPKFDVGVLQGESGTPLRGPAFAAIVPERARVTRVDRDARGPGLGSLTVWFSRSLATGTVPVEVTPKGGIPVALTATATGHRLSIDLPFPADDTLLRLPATLSGEDGQTVTRWACPPEAGLTWLD